MEKQLLWKKMSCLFVSSLLALTHSFSAAFLVGPVSRYSFVPPVVVIFVAFSTFFFPPVASAQLNFDDEILYLDPFGQIKTLDFNQSGPALIDWSSDESGFFEFAVGDFTGDGDPEVAAIKGTGVDGRLVVYDPVVSPNTAIPTARSDNSVPWKLLYERAIGFTPLFVGAGNLDDSPDEDEILVGFDIGGGRSELLVLKIEGVNELQGTGASELPLGGNSALRFDRTWDSVAIGQIDGTGPDEIVLTDSTFIPDTLQSRIAFFRVDGLASNTPFFQRSNSTASWRRVAIGEINGNGQTDIIATRKLIGGTSIPTVFFFEYDPARQTIRDNDDGCPDEPHIPQSCPDDVDSLVLIPRPSRIILADINNNGESEMFFLRSSDLVNGNTPSRFFLINRGTDQIVDTDVSADPYTLHPTRSRDIFPLNPNQNGWNIGTGGDFDGNGNDEVAIGRLDKISTYIFRDENLSEWRVDNLNTKNIQMESANLDSLGFATGVEIIAETSGLQPTVVAGGTLSFDIVARTFDEQLLATLEILDQPDWLIANPTMSGQVPFTLTATIDATSLLPGEYSFSIQAASSDPVVTNSPSVKTIDFRVTPAQVSIDTDAVVYPLFPCDLSTLPSNPSMTSVINIDGTSGITFTTQILPVGTPWLSVNKAMGTVPDTLSLTLSPSTIITPAVTLEAELQIWADPRAGSGTGNIRTISARILCTQSRIYQPLFHQ